MPHPYDALRASLQRPREPATPNAEAADPPNLSRIIALRMWGGGLQVEGSVRIYGEFQERVLPGWYFQEIGAAGWQRILNPYVESDRARTAEVLTTTFSAAYFQDPEALELVDVEIRVATTSH